MTSAEIIELIKTLPREEKEQVFAFVKSLAASWALRDESTERCMDADKAKAVSSKIFSEHSELFRKLAS